jgi:hypothetical protein
MILLAAALGAELLQMDPKVAQPGNQLLVSIMFERDFQTRLQSR